MFTVRSSQIQAFNKIKEQKFIDAIKEKIKSEFKDKMYLNANINLDDEIQSLISFGRKNGLIQASDYEYFILLCFKYGFRSNELAIASVKDIFQFPDRTAKDKLFQFHRFVKFERNEAIGV